MTNQTNPQVPLLPEKSSAIPPAPIHPLAALSTLVLDNIFGIFEIVDPLALVVTSISVGVLNAVATTLVQHYLSKEEWGPSAAKGVVMGILAGVPFQVAGTVVGIPLLGWAGLHEWIKMSGPKQKAPELSKPDEIVEADFKDIEDNK